MSKCCLKCNNDYITRDGNDKYCITTDMQKAVVFDTPDKAMNVVRSSLPSQLSSRQWETMLLEESSQNFEYVKVSLDELKEQIKTTGELFRIIRGNHDWLLQALSDVDKEICDVLHFIELYNFSASDGYKLAKQLKELRIKRREIKDELEIIKIVNESSCPALAKGQVSTRLSNLETRTYTPRVLQEMFDDKNLKTA